MPVRIKVMSAIAQEKIVFVRSEDTVEDLKKKIRDLFGSESLETLALQKTTTANHDCRLESYELDEPDI